MPRPPKHRCCRSDASGIFYKPRGVPLSALDSELIELDEFEAMRLCDLDGLEQETAGEKMGVSRGTIQRLLESGRKKMIAALIARKAIRIGDLPSCCGGGKRCEQ